MKAIMVMFDSLNRRFLPPYGADGVHAPNFTRLAERSVTFENCYAGSMPCMPARRELHTGRYNFLHRSWGPLEPFDDSVPEMLGSNGIYTHLTTDHHHYWEDGGATYHQRYNTFEFFRGQEGDAWKGHAADPESPPSLKRLHPHQQRQDWINRSYMCEESDHPQTGTFDAGIDFIRTNHAENDWFLQIETFDPHEPFFSHDRYKQLYPHSYDGPHFDWPDYRQVLESAEEVAHVRAEYSALLSMCDHSLGRVLDIMDEHQMWDDTMLIVCTDHGFLLGEHGWWGKMVQPFFDETIHTPLFVWDPRGQASGERRESLVQTIDLGPTLLEFFGVEPTPDMLGRSIAPAVHDDTPVRGAALFGSFGGHVSVTDGRYVYMRACSTPHNRPLVEHTLMPTHMRGRFRPEELRSAELVEPLPFTKGVPVLSVPGNTMTNPYAFGTLLFDLVNDPEQSEPLFDDALELRMASLLVEHMRLANAPLSQFARLGLPSAGPVTATHLLTRIQRSQVELGMQPAPDPAEYPTGRLSVHTPLRDLVADPHAAAIVETHLPGAHTGPMLAIAGDLSLLQISALAIGMLPRTALGALADELTNALPA